MLKIKLERGMNGKGDEDDTCISQEERTERFYAD
jgi:hypothetical protein